MCEKSSQDTLDRSDVKFSVPSEDKELIKHKEFFKNCRQGRIRTRVGQCDHEQCQQ